MRKKTLTGMVELMGRFGHPLSPGAVLRFGCSVVEV
jgi:hypothetical protein